MELVDLPKPEVSDGKVLVRMTAAGVTPLDHTILSGQYPEGEGAAGSGERRSGRRRGRRRNGVSGGFTCDVHRTCTVFQKTGPTVNVLPYESSTFASIPEGIDDVSAAGIPVAYLTAQMALSLAGFQAGKTVLAPAIGGSVGNAATQLARALGAKHAISSTTNHTKAEQAKALGFDEVIDALRETLSGWSASYHGRIQCGYRDRCHRRRGLSEALPTLAPAALTSRSAIQQAARRPLMSPI